MKHFLFVAIMSVSSFAWSTTQDWKVVAETSTCDEKIQIMGKDGEKYVLAVRGEEKTKLFAKDGSVFKTDAIKSTEFTSDASSNVKYTFTQPSYVESNPPKIDVAMNGSQTRCKMNLK